MDKKRGANYSQAEKEELIALVGKYKSILENKKTNAVFNKQKIECWEKVANEYNSTQTTGFRTGAQLKSLYEQMKKHAKQHRADDKVQILQTGGGIFKETTTSLDQKILSVIEDNYFTIENAVDSNTDSLNLPNAADTFSTYASDGMPSTSGSLETIFVIEDIVNSSDNKKLETGMNEVEKPIQTNMASLKRGREQLHTKKRMKKDALIKEDKENEERMEIYTLKKNVLKRMEEAEIENVKGKKLDNEIKEIIKQKELLNLKIKQVEFIQYNQVNE